MKKALLFIILTAGTSTLFSQKVDSIYFNLYTDSLKKGQYNYINVDGKLSNGRWMPLTAKEILFSCPTANFEGNQLIIPENFDKEKVVVKAVLKSNNSLWLEKTIWIKKSPDEELPTKEEVLKPGSKRRNKKN